MNSKLILGTVQFGLKYGINNTIGKPTNDEVLSLLKVAYNSGIRVLDTAEAYGNAHQLIGNYHKKQDNSKFEIITKFPHDIKHNLIKSKVFEYLDLMKVNTLGVMMFHSFDSFKSNYNALKTLNELKSDGLINNIGVSVYTNSQLESLINEDLITDLEFENILTIQSIWIKFSIEMCKNLELKFKAIQKLIEDKYDDVDYSKLKLELESGFWG